MRKLPAPPKQKTNPVILGIAVIVSVAFSLLVFAGIVRLALWVGGFDGVLSFRETLGIAVGLFVYRIVDRMFDRTSANGRQGRE